MRASLSILITAFVRSNKEKAIDALEFLMGTPRDLRRLETKVDFREIAADTFDMVLNVLQYQGWSLELHAQLGSELRG